MDEADDAGLAALAAEFERELYDGYRLLARTTKYRAKGFLEMVTMHTGVGAAQLLLRGDNASDGFTRLWELGMLAHSLEATVSKPKYKRLFTAKELETARFRLQKHGFDVDGFLGSQ